MRLYELLIIIDNDTAVNINDGKNILFLGKQGQITFEFLEVMKNKKVTCINSNAYSNIEHLIEIEVK